MTTEDEKKAMKGPVFYPDDQWKSTNWMKLLHQKDWHNSRSIHPGMLAAECTYQVANHLPQQGSDESQKQRLRVLQAGICRMPGSLQ